jgi:DNA invertase Pin-like site-specific DNA recombinase
LAERLDLDVIKVFVDNDVSAASGKRRPQWEAMLDLIESDGITSLIVWHTDRLYRRPTDLERLLDLLDGGRLPGTVRTVTAGDLDLSSPTGRMVARLLVAVGAHEVEHGRERMLRAHRQAALDGEPRGGGRPFGFEPDRTTHRETEAALVREAAGRIIGGESLRSIATDWNARGVPTTSGKASWGVSGLHRMLRSPRLAGLRAHHGEVVAKGTWEPILHEDRWRLMMATLADPARRRQGGRGPRRFWLGGVLVCSLCSHKLRSFSRPDPKNTTYGCPSGIEGGCGRVNVNAAKVEAHVADLIVERLAASDLGDLEPAPTGTRRAEAMAELGAVNERLAMIGAQIGSGAWSPVVAAAAERTALDQQARLEAELRRIALPTATVAIPEGFTREDFDVLDVADRHALASALLAEAVVLPAAYKGQRFDPSRLKVKWADLTAAEAA